MATIHVGGFHPFSKHYKTLQEAFSHAMDSDTIKIHLRRVSLENGLDVNKTLYVDGGGCTIVVPTGKAALYVTNGNLDLCNITFELGMQNNGLVFDSKYFGDSKLTNVNFYHKKTKMREMFPSMMVKGPVEGASGANISFDDCKIDYLDAVGRVLTFNNCKLGNFYRQLSSASASTLKFNNATLANIYLESASPTVIDTLTTPGQLRLNSDFTIKHLKLVNSGIDKGSNKLVYGKKGEKLLSEAISDPAFGNNEVDSIITATGSKTPLKLNMGVLEVDPEHADEKLVKRNWFDVENVSLNFDQSNIKRLDLPSIAVKSSIAMQNTKDFSDWQIDKVTLSNRNSQSQLFTKHAISDDVKLDNQKAENDFGALKELDSMIGLTNVKHFVHQLVDSAKMNMVMQARGINNKNTKSLHMVFAGNPGSGKTEVARIVAKALYEQGVLKNNKLTEVQSGDLISGYVGQTAEKTRKVVESALDGVLFIDEAYTLTHQEGTSFNDEAVAELLKDIDDHRDRIVCILAGYSGEMRQFFAKSNPGLKSRFANWIEFPDYTPKEMMMILQFMLKHRKLYLKDNETAIELKNKMFDLMGSLNVNSGNGRFVRNMVDKLTNEKDARLAQLTPSQMQSLTNRELMTITKEDVDKAALVMHKQQVSMEGI